MITVIRNTRTYLFLSIFFIALTGMIILRYSKTSIHLYINKFYSPITDIFFHYYTNVGDDLFALIIAIALLFYSYRYSLILLTATQMSGLAAQIIKRLVPISPRPSVYFEHIATLHTVKGVELWGMMSFPSGHTATAFSLFFCLSFMVKKPIYQIALFIAALLVAYSRMYLSQHFLVDVFGGCSIGIIIAILSTYAIMRIKSSKLENSLINKFETNEQ